MTREPRLKGHQKVILTFGAYHFFYEAIEFADLSKTAYINYIEGFLSILYGLLFFGESITSFDVVGFLMIIEVSFFVVVNRGDEHRFLGPFSSILDRT